MDKAEARRRALEWMRPDAERQIEEARPFIDEGDGLAVIYAVKICAENEMVMKPWLAAEFIKRANVVLGHGANSWDAAFGEPWPGKHLKTLKQWQRLRIAVMRKVKELRSVKKPPPIDEAFFAQVAKQLSRKLGVKLGRSKVSDLYYDRNNPFIVTRGFRKKTKIRGITG